jgi:hypothetical protein
VRLQCSWIERLRGKWTPAITKNERKRKEREIKKGKGLMCKEAGGIEEDVAIQLTTIIAGPTHNKNVLKNNIIYFFCLQK